MEHSGNCCKNKILTIPNVLSFFRLGLIPLIVWQYVWEKNFTLSLCLLALSGLTDIADGIIARTFDMVSDFGKIFDPVADKLTQTAVMVCLVTRFPAMLLPLLLLIVKESFAAITGLMIVRRGVVLGADWHGKVTTVLLYGTMLLHLAWVDIPVTVSHSLIGGCAAMLILSGVLYGIRNLKVLAQRREPV
ncbi:MAG: CDP-alcohol phosphatidyltransferase family protein [Oscillospiraceae bacterium]|nr:CDP-alcohol phosphatidyltransferase family protein [Oscillospiraceae bacterium]